MGVFADAGLTLDTNIKISTPQRSGIIGVGVWPASLRNTFSLRGRTKHCVAPAAWEPMQRILKVLHRAQPAQYSPWQ